MNYSKEDCIRMLCGKYEELRNSGENRFPARGIKEADPERLEKKKQQRINQKRKKTQRKIEKNNSAE